MSGTSTVGESSIISCSTLTLPFVIVLVSNRDMRHGQLHVLLRGRSTEMKISKMVNVR